jgi:hypothetical protein
MLRRFGAELQTNRTLSRAVVLLAGIIVLLSFSMAGMGYFISSGFRSAHEQLMH